MSIETNLSYQFCQFYNQVTRDTKLYEIETSHKIGVYNKKGDYRVLELFILTYGDISWNVKSRIQGMVVVLKI